MHLENNIETLYHRYWLNNYAAPNLTLIRGEGEKVWDDRGHQYLDFTSGIATTSIGHCHPKLVAAIGGQIEKIIHVSNLFRNETQARLAEALVEKIAPGRVFFCNSGTEASETLLKLSRLFGAKKRGTNPFKVIVSSNAFHGRTFGGMSATPQPKIQKSFKPLLPNFPVAKFNDSESFAALIDRDTAAILIEPIQGEGGIHVATREFLQDLRTLCTDNGILLLMDEVQSGMGRTGAFLAHEIAGITPDAIGLAKGLGGGFPIGAVWISDTCADLFTPGSHGSTFGGNPLGCAAALAVLQTIDEENLLSRVRKLSAPWIEQLNDLKKRHELVVEVRGRGFLVGLELKENPDDLRNLLQQVGLLTVAASGNVLRLLPPLTVSEASLRKSIQTLDTALTTYSETRAAKP